MAGRDNAKLKREQACEVLALRAFNRADRDGVAVTRKLVGEVLAELAGHRSECSCGVCSLLPLATACQVYWLASRWSWSINRTRARAAR